MICPRLLAFQHKSRFSHHQDSLQVDVQRCIAVGDVVSEKV